MSAKVYIILETTKLFVDYFVGQHILVKRVGSRSADKQGVSKGRTCTPRLRGVILLAYTFYLSNFAERQSNI